MRSKEKHSQVKDSHLRLIIQPLFWCFIQQQPWQYLQEHPIDCAFRNMGASECPTDTTSQGTHACNLLLMWITFKLGEWLSSVPHSVKYHRYLHILQAIFRKLWVSGPDHRDMLPCRNWFSDFQRKVCTTNVFRKGLNSVV